VEPLRIGHRLVGPGQACYVVAEMSANHHHDYGVAVDLFHAAKEAGADAIKVQTYTADTITLDAATEPFVIRGGGIGEGRTLHSLYREAHTPWPWQRDLKAVASELGLDFFSTPFDGTAIEFLESLEVPAYKIASFELVDVPLLKRVAATRKPVILSTGMATRQEIGEAVEILRAEGAEGVALLKCTSAYPADPREMNLRTIPDMMTTFGAPVGLSDHTMGIETAVAAVALGACIVEKHLTLSRAAPGPDSRFSLEPAEFRAMVQAVRVTEQALGRVSYEATPSELATRAFRRSLFVVRDMKAGEPFTTETVRAIRPAGGLHTRHLEEVVGRRARCDIARGTPLSWDLIR
jgi:N-acetylneuraminate synthase